jgi:hypothetical protein
MEEGWVRVINRGKFRWNGWDLMEKLADTPMELVQWVKAKTGTLLYEGEQLEAMQPIRIGNESISLLQNLLKELVNPPLSAPGKLPTMAEQSLIGSIRAETVMQGRNNVTRTIAYWRLYRHYPELHWAFLAHMVSRNGGWNMSDLKGELLPFLLNDTQCEHVFALLERANALIFHDAYPQLLLYAASRRARMPLFHLLPHFGVSVFMSAVWMLFWQRPDSPLLTTALIINEQHYIESRVLRHPVYRHTVLDTLFFGMQSLLQLNQVLFPYKEGNRIRLAGLILEDFNNIRERIEVGKKLYAMLFGIPVVFQGAKLFALANPHTGSRADFWPHLFAAVRQAPPKPPGQLQEWLNGCSLRPGASPLYSPRLEKAWNDRPFAQAGHEDWYTNVGDERSIELFTSVEPPFSFEMTHEFGFGLNKIELAVLAGDLVK